MSYAIFPTLANVPAQIKKRPTWNTAKERTAAGNEFRTGFQQFPVSEFDITYPFLSQADKSALEGFINEQSGSLTPFYFDVLNDDTIASPFGFGNGDGTTKAFTLLKSAGTGAVEQVGGVNGTPVIYDSVSGVNTQIPSAPLATPGAATLGSVAGGSLSATTYYVRIAWLQDAGTTLAGTEASLAVTASHLLTVTQPTPPAGASGWVVYVSTASGSETLQFTMPISTTSWTEPTSGLVSGAALPGVNTTGWSLSGNLITFNFAPFSGNVLTWTGSYFYLVRFKEDKIEFTQFANGLYKTGNITLVQCL